MKLNDSHIAILERVRASLIKSGVDSSGPDFICHIINPNAFSDDMPRAEVEIIQNIERVLGHETFGTWLARELRHDADNDPNYYQWANQGRLMWVETMITRREIR